MIAARNKVIRVHLVARVSKADKVAKALEVVTWGTRVSRVEQVVVPRANRVNKARDNKEVQIVIARTNKETCPIATASMASRIRLLHLTRMTKTWSKGNTKLRTGIRIQTAA